jgi:hypothetical protein
MHPGDGLGMLKSRRRFLGDSLFALASVTGGALTLNGCESSGASLASITPAGSTTSANLRSAGFAWTVDTFEDDSAYAYFRVTRESILESVRVDAALVPAGIAGTPGSIQAACRGWISRGGLPAFIAGAGGVTGPTVPSADFGSIAVYNPSSLTVAADGSPLQDVFYSTILRSWVPTSGVDSATARAVHGLPVLALHTGDYLVFGIEQSGVSGSVQLQAILDYE